MRNKQNEQIHKNPTHENMTTNKTNNTQPQAKHKIIENSENKQSEIRNNNTYKTIKKTTKQTHQNENMENKSKRTNKHT